MDELPKSPLRKLSIVSALGARASNRRETQKLTELLINNPYVKGYLNSINDKAIIQNEVRTLKRRLTRGSEDIVAALEQIKPKEEKDVKPIHSATDSVITDETLVYYYKGKPIYIDFLHINEYKKSNDIENYLDQMKKDLTIYKWGTLREKDKLYYLYNKTEYYAHLLKIKEESKNKYESLISSKNKEIRDLQESIQEREQQNKSSTYNKIDIMKKKENIEKLEKELAEFPSMIGELEKKVRSCDQIIQNYENPSEGLSINEIIQQLKEERSRLNSEITKQNEVTSELDEEIRDLEESIKILDFKNILPKK